MASERNSALVVLLSVNRTAFAESLPTANHSSSPLSETR